MGLIALATLSAGEKIPALRAARRAERKLLIAQRHLSRYTKSRRSREKVRTCVARHHLKVKDQRRTYAHQVSKRLIDHFNLIAVKDLSVRDLARPRLAKSVCDAGWSP